MLPGLLLLLAGILVLGWCVLRAIGLPYRADRLAYPAWAFLAGSMGFALFELAWLALGRPVGFAPSCWSLVGLVLIGLLLMRAGGVQHVSNPEVAGDTGWLGAGRWVAVVGVALLVALTLDRITAGNVLPRVLGDEATIWSSKARVLFFSRGSWGQLRTDLLDHVWHVDYPWLNPLLQLAAFETAGEVLYTDQRWPIQGFMIAMVFALVAGLRRLVRPWLAVVLALLFFSHGQVVALAGGALADMMIALALFVSVDAWLRFRETGCVAFHRLFCVGLGGLVWTKNEGTVLAILVVFGAACHALTTKDRTSILGGRRGWLFLLVPVGFAVLNESFKVFLRVENDLFEAGQHGSFASRALRPSGDRVAKVAGALLGEFFSRPSRGLVALAGVLWLCFPKRMISGPALVPSVCVFGGIAVYWLVFLASPHDLDWHMHTALARVCMPLAPVAGLVIAIAIADLDPRLRPAPRLT